VRETREINQQVIKKLVLADELKTGEGDIEMEVDKKALKISIK